ncbi:MAG: glucose-phosphate adenylyltransferase [Candidatus Atribacteria bacterium]|nr:glucose-phosphate adenylyltransferase [Candidatus Atribacteria bacterium]
MYKREVLTLILAGGEGKRLDILSEKRAKPAVPFGGKYRIIDFPLSNCVNSGLYCIGIPTPYNPRSLHEHIGIGKFWDLDRMEGGVFLLQPYISDVVTNWYRGTADAVYQNLRFIRDHDPHLVLVLSGDHVYKMDYRSLIRFHQEKRADLTVAVIEVPWEEAHRFGVLSLDEQERVTDFEEKPLHPRSNLINMGIYVFDRHILEEEVEEEALREDTSFDFGKDIIPRMIRGRRVYGFRFSGYWKDVGTIDAYWEANMELLGSSPALDLYDKEWPIYTFIEDRPPVKMSYRARVRRSLLGSGAIIDGSVEDSVIFSGVYVSRGAEVRHSIIMSDTRIEEEAVIDRAILDKNIIVGSKARVGYGESLRPNQTIPDMLKSGLTVVGRNARIPSGAIVGRNCRVGADIKEEDFSSLVLENGESIEKPKEEWK